MEDKIISIIAARTKQSEDYLKAHKDEKKLWDSLQHVEIVLALEEEYDLMFGPEDIEAMQDINSIITIVQRKVM